MKVQNKTWKLELGTTPLVWRPSIKYIHRHAGGDVVPVPSVSAGHLPEVGVVAVGQQWVGQLPQEQLEAARQHVDVILSVTFLEKIPFALKLDSPT